MNTTVEPKKMREIAGQMSTAVTNLNSNILKLVSAVKEAQKLKDKAKKYDGKELDGERFQYKYRKGGGENNKNIRIVKYYAHVNNSEGGMASSGMRSITGAPKEYALQQITKILDFTDEDVPAVAECIEQGIEEIETTLAKLDANRNTDSNDPTDTNNPIDTNDSTDTNEPTNTNDNNSNSNPDYGSSGGSGGGGGKTGVTPQYKKASEDNSKSKKTSDDPTSKNQSNNSTNTNKTNNTNTNTNTNTENEENKDNTTQTNTQTTTIDNNNPVSSTPAENTNGTNPDNPTPSASVVLGNSGSGKSSPNYSNENNTSAGSTIEVLGEESPINNTNANDLGDSIINGVNRVIPGIKSGEKIQTGSAFIPGAAGVTAAAAAGLGSKALLDKSDNYLSIPRETDEDDNDENNNHSHKDKNKDEDKGNDKGWLYGMGIGLGTVGAAGAAIAKKEHDKEEDYEIADDTPPEPETLEDD